MSKGKKLITGINSSQQSVESGSNDHARIYSFEEEKWGLFSKCSSVS